MNSHAPKSASLSSAIGRLRQLLGENYFVTVDHWPADVNAIGLADPRDYTRLVYLSVLDARPDHFFVSLETSPSGEWNDFPYTPGAEKQLLGIEAVAQEVRSHFVGAAA
jgi:hypothetical protein